MRHETFEYVIMTLIALVVVAAVTMVGYSVYWNVKFRCVQSHWEDDTCYHSIPSGDNFIMIPYDCKTEKCDKWIER
jgi:hypothetical protein